MTFLSEVKSATRCIPTCSVGLALSSIVATDPELHDEVIETLDLPLHEGGHTAIVRAFKARGYNVNRDAVARHRNGDCKCP